MTVRFVLSREEYQKRCRQLSPKPDWAASVTRVFIAFGIAIVAAAIAVAHGGRDAGLCVLLMLWAGVTGGVAVYESTIGALIRRHRFARAVRDLYRRKVQDKEIEFSFDEKSWKSQEDAGVEVPWSDLEYAAEQDGIIRLQAGKAHALVPVRALSPESLSQLRALAFGEFSAMFTVRAGIKEYLLAEIPELWRRRRSGMARDHGVGLFATAGLTAWLWRDHRPEDIPWIIGLSGSLLFITLTTQFWYHLIAYATLWLGKRTPWELECSERGMHIRTKEWEYFGAWLRFPKFRKRDRRFCSTSMQLTITSCPRKTCWMVSSRDCVRCFGRSWRGRMKAGERWARPHVNISSSPSF